MYLQIYRSSMSIIAFISNKCYNRSYLKYFGQRSSSINLELLLHSLIDSAWPTEASFSSPVECLGLNSEFCGPNISEDLGGRSAWETILAKDSSIKTNEVSVWEAGHLIESLLAELQWPHPTSKHFIYLNFWFRF